jgi:PAB1-binding protein PBP1
MKTFEWRRDDGRDFQVGDVLELARWNPQAGSYGAFEGGNRLSSFPIAETTLTAQVSFVLRGQFGVPDGYCVLSLRGIEPMAQPASVVAGEGPKDASVP